MRRISEQQRRLEMNLMLYDYECLGRCVIRCSRLNPRSVVIETSDLNFKGNLAIGDLRLLSKSQFRGVLSEYLSSNNFLMAKGRYNPQSLFGLRPQRFEGILYRFIA